MRSVAQTIDWTCGVGQQLRDNPTSYLAGQFSKLLVQEQVTSKRKEMSLRG